MNAYRMIMYVLAVIGLAAPSLFGGGLDLEKPEWEKLFAGEAIVRQVSNPNRVPGIRLAFIVAAPREDIWKALTDYRNFPRIFKGTQSAKVKKQGANWTDVEIVFKKKSMGFINLTYKYVFHREYHPEEQRLTWQRLKGDFSVIEGFWQVSDTDRPGHLLLVYESYLDGQWFFPARIVRNAALKEAVDMSANVRDWVENKMKKEENR